MATTVDTLAAWRLTRLLTEDKVTEPVRDRLANRGPHWEYLVECPHCVGVWVAGAVTAARRTRLWAPIADALAIAAVVSLISEARAWIEEQQ